MKQLAFSLLDEKAGTFSPPVFYMTPGLVVRAISDMISEGKSPIAKHAEDYVLYEVGAFDEVTGKLSVLDAPKQVIRLSSLSVAQVPEGAYERTYQGPGRDK